MKIRTTTFTPRRTRLGTLALATALVTTLAACGGDTDDDTGGDAGGDAGGDTSTAAEDDASDTGDGSAEDQAAGGDGTSTEDIHIAFIGADGSQNFTQEMLKGAEAAGEEFGVDVHVLAPTALDGQAQRALSNAALGRAGFRIGCKVANENHFVHRSHLLSAMPYSASETGRSSSTISTTGASTAAGAASAASRAT